VGVTGDPAMTTAPEPTNHFSDMTKMVQPTDLHFGPDEGLPVGVLNCMTGRKALL